MLKILGVGLIQLDEFFLVWFFVLEISESLLYSHDRMWPLMAFVF